MQVELDTMKKLMNSHVSIITFGDVIYVISVYSSNIVTYLQNKLHKIIDCVIFNKKNVDNIFQLI